MRQVMRLLAVALPLLLLGCVLLAAASLWLPEETDVRFFLLLWAALTAVLTAFRAGRRCVAGWWRGGLLAALLLWLLWLLLLAALLPQLLSIVTIAAPVLALPLLCLPAALCGAAFTAAAAELEGEEQQ